MKAVDDVLSILEKWPAWKRITEAPARLDALEAQLQTLEKELVRQRSRKICPFCGSFSWHMEWSSHPTEFEEMSWRDETWACESCGKKETHRVSTTPTTD